MLKRQQETVMLQSSSLSSSRRQNLQHQQNQDRSVKPVGCLSGILHLVSKYQRRPRRKFLTFGKKQGKNCDVEVPVSKVLSEGNQIPSSPSTALQVDGKKKEDGGGDKICHARQLSHQVPRSPTLSVEIRQSDSVVSPDNFRESVPYGHTTGSRSFAAVMTIAADREKQRIAIEVNDDDGNGNDPNSNEGNEGTKKLDLCDLFEASHRLRDTNEWINSTCQEKHEMMVKTRDEAALSGTPLSTEELSIKCLGEAKTKNYIRGLGNGPKPSIYLSKSNSQSASEDRLQKLQRELDLIREEQRREREEEKTRREEEQRRREGRRNKDDTRRNKDDTRRNKDNVRRSMRRRKGVGRRHKGDKMRSGLYF